MAEHTGKDVLSKDVVIKGSIKFQKELIIDGKVAARLVIEDGATFIGKSEVTSGKVPANSNSGSTRPEIVRNDESPAPAKTAFAGRS